jgi:ABC-2 type transport system permease protein
MSAVAWSTIRTIALKEMVEMVRDNRFRWATGITLTILAASLVAGQHQFSEMRDLHERAQREERDRWLNKGLMNGHPAMHFGIFVYKPYLPLSALDDGIAPYVGSYMLVEAHEQKLFQDKPAEDRIPMRRIGEMSAAVCLQVLMPLLIILLGFSSFVYERERGTWRQVLSLGVSFRDLCVGKALGVTLPIAMVLTPSALIGSLAILLHSPVLLDGTPVRLAILTATYLLYFLIILTITLSASMLAQSSRQALLALLIFWFANCLMIPRLGTDVAAGLYPDPTSFQVAAQIIKDRLSNHIKTMPEIERDLLAQYNAKSPAQIPVNIDGIYLLDEQRVNDKIYGRALSTVYDTYLRQDRVVRWAGVVAPMLAAQSISMALAGSDIATHRHFAEYARVYRTNMETVLNQDTAYHLPPGPRGRELWEKIPPFDYKPPGLLATLGTTAVSFAVLAAWTFLAVVAIRRAALRMAPS